MSEDYTSRNQLIHKLDEVNEILCQYFNYFSCKRNMTNFFYIHI